VAANKCGRSRGTKAWKARRTPSAATTRNCARDSGWRNPAPRSSAGRPSQYNLRYLGCRRPRRRAPFVPCRGSSESDAREWFCCPQHDPGWRHGGPGHAGLGPQNPGDVRKALEKTQAYLSGHNANPNLHSLTSNTHSSPATQGPASAAQHAE